MKNITLIILLIITGFIIWKSQEPRLKEHNNYQCAVLGYEEDCKTPLPEERRLK